jgi:hypothetical protein
MYDLNQLRDLTSQVRPPSFDSLVITARRRTRLTRRVASGAAVSVAGTAVILAIGGGALRGNGEDRFASGPADSPTTPSQSTVFDPDEPTLPGGVKVLSQSTAYFSSLDGGRYGVRVSDSLLYSVDVPDNSEVFDGVYLNPLSEELGRDAILWIEVADNDTALPVDPCQDHTAKVVGPTVRDLATALSDQPFLTVTRPVEVTVGGIEGLFVKVTVPDDAELSACQEGRVAIYAHIDKPSDGSVADSPGLVDRMWILDVDGARHVLRARAWPNAPGQQVRAMTRMVESITFSRR